MNTLTVTMELCLEDRARLDKILEALTSHNCSACAESNTEFVAKFVADKLAATAPEKPQDEPQPEPEAEPATEPEMPSEPVTEASEPVKTVELADIQKKVVELSAAGKKAEVRDIVKRYADRVSAIPADKTVEVWELLTALEG